MNKNIFETITGFIVIGVALFFFAFGYSKQQSNDKGYLVTANFQNAEGIVKGSNVMLAGIKIGNVEEMSLNYDNFFAVIDLRIKDTIKLPKDSNASIVSSGFLGGKYISISPGISTETFKDKDKIFYTQSSVNLESLVGKFIYTFSGSNNSNQ